MASPKGTLNARTILRALIAALYLVAGYLHICATQVLLLITPSWVPYPGQVVFATGLFEIIAGIALLYRPLRRVSGYALAVYAVLVFPANLVHAFYNIHVPGLPSSWLYHAPRLALQPVLVWATLFAAEIVNWPFVRNEVPASRRQLDNTLN